MVMVFRCRHCNSFLLTRQCVKHLLNKTSTTKKRKCPFLVLKRNIKHMRTSSALLAVVKTRSFVNLKVNTLFGWACWAIHLSYYILISLLCLSKNIKLLVTLQENEIGCFSKRTKEYCAANR